MSDQKVTRESLETEARALFNAAKCANTRDSANKLSRMALNLAIKAEGLIYGK